MIIRRIISIAFLFILFLMLAAYAEYPTSTPESIGPDGFNLIEGIKETLFGSPGSTGSSETPGGGESMEVGSSASSSATDVIWSGLGDNELASNPENWSGGLVPQNGDRVAFDGTSKNCTWDLAVILGSFSINPGYTGKVTLESNLTISDDFVWTGMGEDNLASNPANWSKNAVPEEGHRVVFNGRSSKDCDWDINVSPLSFTMETAYAGAVTLSAAMNLSEYLNISGGVLNLTGHDLTVNGYLLIAQGAALNAGTSTITVKGDWLNAGTFNCGQSTVVLNGAGQTVYGNTAFYKLEKSAACPVDTLTFASGSLQTILGRLTLKGAEGCLLAMKSTLDGQQWSIDPQGYPQYFVCEY